MIPTDVEVIALLFGSLAGIVLRYYGYISPPNWSAFTGTIRTVAAQAVHTLLALLFWHNVQPTYRPVEHFLLQDVDQRWGQSYLREPTRICRAPGYWLLWLVDQGYQGASLGASSSSSRPAVGTETHTSPLSPLDGPTPRVCLRLPTLDWNLVCEAGITDSEWIAAFLDQSNGIPDGTLPNGLSTSPQVFTFVSTSDSSDTFWWQLVLLVLTFVICLWLLLDAREEAPAVEIEQNENFAVTDLSISSGNEYITVQNLESEAVQEEIPPPESSSSAHSENQPSWSSQHNRGSWRGRARGQHGGHFTGQRGRLNGSRGGGPHASRWDAAKNLENWRRDH